MIDFIASLLYPKKCVKCRRHGEYICDNCLVEIKFLDFQICAICQRGSIDGLTHPKCKTRYGIDGIISSIAYRGIAKKLLYQFKYPPYLSDLKSILGRVFYEGVIQQEAFIDFINKKDVYIIAVPLHPTRLRKRGYNQAELLAKELSRVLKIPYIPGLLSRKNDTKPQFKLSKKERGENVRGAFQINSKFKIQNSKMKIILVDDISTTGATLKECAKMLKKSGVRSVVGVVLAHEEGM